jgi:hypothetical protein
MNLIDAGPLVALNDQGDPFHHRCVETVAANQPAHFATTWPCLAEAMHFSEEQAVFRFNRRCGEC